MSTVDGQRQGADLACGRGNLVRPVMAVRDDRIQIELADVFSDGRCRLKCIDHHDRALRGNQGQQGTDKGGAITGNDTDSRPRLNSAAGQSLLDVVRDVAQPAPRIPLIVVLHSPRMGGSIESIPHHLVKLHPATPCYNLITKLYRLSY